MDYNNIFIDTSNYELKSQIICKGTYASVYLIEDKRDHKLYACKRYFFPESFDGFDEIHIMNESTILYSLNHPSIIKFKGLSFKSIEDPSKYDPFIITEYLKNGTLGKILDKERKGLCPADWTPTKKYISLIGIASAMKYMHSHSILHRDLKTDNIFIDDDFYPKIGGFGLSRSFNQPLTDEIDQTDQRQVGTLLYMAPELFEEKLVYGPSVDVFAFSYIAYEIVTGKLPYEEERNNQTFHLIDKVIAGYRPKMPSSVPRKMRELIQRCWDNDKRKRPSFDEIFNLLSSDFSYSKEEIDEEEVNLYLEGLN